MRTITRSRRLFVPTVLVALGACSAPIDQPAGGAPATDVDPVEPSAVVEPLDSLGAFEGRFDHLTGEITVRPLVDDPLVAPLAPKADSLSEVAASSSGVPAGGGVVAFSPSASTTVGCPGGGTRCGPVRLVNRTTGNTVLRNAYAVVTSLTSGWSLANDDGPRAFGFPGVPGTPIGYLYYEHLLASDRPSSTTTPADGVVGFRADRTWSFTQGSGAPANFTFTFYVFARSVACTPTTTEESPTDAGYSPTVDRDCDGVPGVSRNRALFVDPVDGVDAASSDGSILRPFRTPTYAATQSTSTRDTIVIGGATYTSSAARLDLTSTSVRNVIGAFDASNGFADRRLSGGNLDPTTTVLQFATGAPHGFALYRSGASAPLYVEGLTLRAVAGATGTAYALFNSGTSAATLRVRDVALFATGGAGASGAAGTPGVSGRSGLPESLASVPANGCAIGTAGNGGAGGAGADGIGFGGSGGNGGTASTGATGGSGGFWLGDNGSPGTSGANGTAGAAPSSSALQTSWFGSGSFSPTGQIGGTGTPGANGGGGGGGAGEGAFFGTGNHGSSGGSGGCGGTGATGGGAGGGAFGIFSHATSGTSSVTLLGTVSVTASAGNGGAGGASVAGGAGGSGAGGVSGGGAGGNGGAGGAGGGGAGGNGGPAVCVVVRGTAPAPASCVTSTGGAGGTGGSGPVAGPNGNPGAKQATFGY